MVRTVSHSRFAVIGLEHALHDTWRAGRIRYGRLHEDLRARGQMRVAQRVGKLVLTARHQYAADDLPRQQEFDGFGEARLALAIGAADRGQQGRQVEGLYRAPERAEALDFRLLIRHVMGASQLFDAVGQYLADIGTGIRRARVDAG